MDKVLGFLSSSLGKMLIAFLVIAIVSYIVFLQYQKKIFGGFTRSKVVTMLANKLAKERIEYIKKNDQNWLNGVVDNESKDYFKGVLQWYEDNSPSEVTDVWLKREFKRMKIDFVKNPQTLGIANDIENSVSFLNNY